MMDVMHEAMEVRKRVGDDVYFLAVAYAWFHYQELPVGDYEKKSTEFAKFALRNGWRRS